MDPASDPRSEAHLAPLLEALRRTPRPNDEEAIRRAFVFASEAHAKQRRRSGEPYITHPVAVAAILADLLGQGAATSLIQAALLHDVVEDTEQKLAQVNQAFGPEVAALVDGVTKISGIHLERPEREQAEAWLLQRLAEGPVAVRVLKEESDLQPYSWDTIKRAAKELGIRGEGEKKARVWMLPGQSLATVVKVDFGTSKGAATPADLGDAPA